MGPSLHFDDTKWPTYQSKGHITLISTFYVLINQLIILNLNEKNKRMRGCVHEVSPYRRPHMIGPKMGPKGFFFLEGVIEND